MNILKYKAFHSFIWQRNVSVVRSDTVMEMEIMKYGYVITVEHLMEKQMEIKDS